MQNIYQLLQEIGKTYIIHRYYVTCDRVFWSNFTTNYEGAILTLDYSENELAEKYEIDVIWFYGITGHGRGLVDAMSSFGC